MIKAPVPSSRWIFCLFLFLLGIPIANGFQETLAKPAFNSGEGAYITGTVQGQTVYTATNNYLYYRLSGTFPAGSRAYLKITYYDDNTTKKLGLQYDGTSNAYTTSNYHTRSSCEGINAFATSYHRLDSPLFTRRENGATDMRIIGKVTLQSIVVQDTPFPDPMAELALSITPPWTQVYTGKSRNDVNAASIHGKVLAGYQGWFRTPNDLEDTGFSHWTVDQWPDPNDYEPESLHRVPGVTTVSGKPAYCFSSADPAVVRRHFEWMRKYNIDGVYLQRFFAAAKAGAGPEWVLANVRAAAHQEGRVWALEYDLSGGDDATLVSKIATDWKWLVDTCRITSDSRYLHEGGKPVVVLWGASIRDYLSAAKLNELVDFFHNDPVYGGNYVVGCVSPNFPSAWETHYPKYDSLFAWQGGVPGYQNIATKSAQYGIKSQMHVWPGFSWHNLMQLVYPAQYTDRSNGTFYWSLISGGLDVLNPEAIFVGMFDEYNEGTAVMPMGDDPPLLTGTVGHYVTNEGSSKDWWMTLSGKAQEMLTKQMAFTTTMPTEAALANRSNIGEELTATLGPTNSSNLLQHVELSGDGPTVSGTLDGVTYRRGTNYYMYFKVDDSVVLKSGQGTDVTLLVDYYDAGGGAYLGLQYDSTTANYTNHAKYFALSSSSTWRTARFEINNAYFGNRQNGGADFRLKSNAFNGLCISRVRVVLPEDRILTFTKDIGTPALAGDSVFASGTCTLLGSGTGIGTTADAFRFSYLPLTGDCTLTARVLSVSGSNSQARAGVMIREALTAGSKQVLLAQKSGSEAIFQYRPTTSGSTATATVAGSAPIWLKIERTGDVFTTYVSTTGSTWTTVGTQSVPMNRSAFVGLCTTSHDNASLCTAVFDNLSITYPSGNLLAKIVAPFSSVPAAPGGLAATSGDGQITLNWTSANNAERYSLWRKTGASPSYELMADGLAATSYTDTGLANGSPYSYLVTAESSDGSSPNSISVTATPLSAVQAWRQTYFGTFAEEGSAADIADPDGDGQSNLTERIAGTNPTSAADHFKVQSASLSGTSSRTYTLQFKSKANNTYLIEYKADLTTPIWQTLETVPSPSDGILSRSYPASSGRGFYRVRTTSP